MKHTATREMALVALLTSLASVMHYVEALLPVPYVMPGAKLGLANVVTLYVVFWIGPIQSIVLSVLRTTIGGLLSGTLLSPTYILSFSGAILSAISMSAAHRAFRGAGPIGVSILGAVAHNMGQLLAAAFIVRQVGVFFYMPYLLFLALPTGAFTGILVTRLPSRLGR